ncbi:Belongs to the eukaryotic ribosomal protein eL15 [Metarhizium acridum]|uniref:Belongs to the eukaryotic ribosomal protein eL15 n=1 Tax=Metarhizium acridum TaxID=92637 RepID=UPI001C6B0212|nr:Belongs to the eukaryotic ribosomal protein eL15 [Metarhizium acridum]
MFSSGTYSRVAKKAKINTQDARRDLENTARDLQAQIKTRIICHASSLHQLPTIKELMTKNFPDDISILPHTCSPYPGQTSGIANDPYHKAMRTLDGFRVLMKDYEELSKHESDIRMPSWVRWKQDGMDLQLLSASLMGHSMKYAEQNIIPNASRISTNIGNDDIDHIAAELLQETWPQKMGGTWGNTTEGILQTLFGLAVFLP